MVRKLFICVHVNELYGLRDEETQRKSGHLKPEKSTLITLMDPKNEMRIKRAILYINFVT